ncbi:MAG: sigma 54-dependent Fis family transcriptional regulator [Alphaproteobacteria bacterium]|nr:sigma 54-dependent Fis family transcriptional regulator [Alphaproteobacteria bacterium]
MDEATATWQPASADRPADERCPAVVLVGFPSDPARMGEVARLEQGERVLGRHGTLDWVQQRPSDVRRRGPLDDPHLSRQQLKLTRRGDRIEVENLGRLPLRHDGHPVSTCIAAPGDLLQVADRVLLLVTTRPEALPGQVAPRHRFGEADAQGILGESEAAWQLRERVAFFARRGQHVLVLGESGTGKELVAQGLHALSARSGKPLVSRNAATIPDSLADAELFGNLAGYPNPGMPARPGLVGEADGTTLFLDEFGELPEEQQARMLRVMDSGEYTRLGEARPRTSDLRVVGATNRAPESLKHDVLARFPLRLEVPPLGDRREDVPLLAVHLLRGIAKGDPEIRDRFFEPAQGGAPAFPRLDVELLARLVAHPYTTHVRELTSLLWQSIAASTGDRLEVPPDGFVVAPGPVDTPLPRVQSGATDPLLLDPQTIQEALDRHAGRQDPVWRELGLASRHVLARLVKRHGLKVRGRG